MKDLEEKLRALLEGLGTQNIDKLMSEGKVGDFRIYGKAYLAAVKDKVEASYQKGAHKALEEAAEKAEIKVVNDTGWSYTTGSDRFSNVMVSVDDISILSLKEKY